MKSFKNIILVILLLILSARMAVAQEQTTETSTPSLTSKSDESIFDDQRLLTGYTERYRTLPKGILIEMMKDETLTPYKSAGAIKVFKEKYAPEIVYKEKKIIVKIILRLLNREDSPFVQVEGMHTLCVLDRYHYFQTMVPALIHKLDHYNSVINQMAFDNLNDLLKASTTRPREARIVFNTLRKMLFLSRNRLANVKEPDEKLILKLKLVRSSIKILGNQELKKLPKEVIPLL